MTIEDAKQSNNIAHLDENIAKIDELTQRLTKALTLRKPPNPQIAAPESELFARAATAYWQEWMQNPAKILEHQVDYWGKSLKHIVEAQQLLAQGKLEIQPLFQLHQAAIHDQFRRHQTGGRGH